MTITNPAKRLLLNCDMGESLGPWRMGADEQVMPLVDMANIACGFHASDPVTMARTVTLAKQSGTRIGAHPGYPDLVGFGRRSMKCNAQEVSAFMQYQIGALDAICRAQNLRVCYVKPHGALYNDMMADHELLRAVLGGVARLNARLPLMVLATADDSSVQALADEYDVPLIFEAFADRAYDDKGLLLPRTQEGAVFRDRKQILQRSLQLAQEGTITTAQGTCITLKADTLCVHSDNIESVRAVKSIRVALDEFYDKPAL